MEVTLTEIDQPGQIETSGDGGSSFKQVRYHGDLTPQCPQTHRFNAFMGQLNYI
jgi:hypothetical protein